MQVIDAIRRSAVAVDGATTIRHASEVMESAGIGALAVVDGDTLVGVVTDRDLVRRALARGLDPEGRIDAVMTTPPVTVDAEADLHEAFAVLRQHAVRRLPVVRGDRLVGMVTVDDLLVDLIGDLGDLIRPVTAEVVFAHHDSPLPIPT